MITISAEPPRSTKRPVNDAPLHAPRVAASHTGGENTPAGAKGVGRSRLSFVPFTNSSRVARRSGTRRSRPPPRRRVGQIERRACESGRRNRTCPCGPSSPLWASSWLAHATVGERPSFITPAFTRPTDGRSPQNGYRKLPWFMFDSAASPEQNAMIERFFGSLKAECVWRHRFEKPRPCIPRDRELGAGGDRRTRDGLLLFPCRPYCPEQNGMSMPLARSREQCSVRRIPHLGAILVARGE